MSELMSFSGSKHCTSLYKIFGTMRQIFKGNDITKFLVKKGVFFKNNEPLMNIFCLSSGSGLFILKAFLLFIFKAFKVILEKRLF